MKSASQPSSEINKAGSLAFAGIVFYCGHILQQAQARDAQVGQDLSLMDVTEVDSAESLSDQSSTLVAELKDSPLNDTETIATADLSVVQVADNDDDASQEKDSALASDQSDGGISPIFLVGTTVLIGVGALLINNDENDNSSSPSEVASSERYDLDRDGMSTSDSDDDYFDDDFWVGVARSISSEEAALTTVDFQTSGSLASSMHAQNYDLDGDGDIELLEVIVFELASEQPNMPVSVLSSLASEVSIEDFQQQAELLGLAEDDIDILAAQFGIA